MAIGGEEDIFGYDITIWHISRDVGLLADVDHGVAMSERESAVSAASLCVGYEPMWVFDVHFFLGVDAVEPGCSDIIILEEVVDVLFADDPCIVLEDEEMLCG